MTWRVATGCIGDRPSPAAAHRQRQRLRRSAVKSRGLAWGQGSSFAELLPNTRSQGGVMGPLRELLAIDHRQALEFFVLRLQDVSEPTVDRQRLNRSSLMTSWRY
jgi:hypothetical protein